MKRTRSSRSSLPEVALRLCVGEFAVPAQKVDVRIEDKPESRSLLMLQGRSRNLRWLEMSLDLKVRSLSVQWPLLEEIVAAKDSHFGSRTRLFRRVDTSGVPVHTQDLFQVSVRGFELPIYAPRTDLLYVECTETVVQFLVDQTTRDLATPPDAPHTPHAPLGQEKPDGAQEAPLREEQQEGTKDPDSDLHEELHHQEELPPEHEEQPQADSPIADIQAIILELKQMDSEVTASWYPSRYSFVVHRGILSKPFLAPHFRQACRRGDAQSSLSEARHAAISWLQEVMN